MDLSGKTVVITGAAQGIGLGCAEEFAAHGAHVVLSDVLEEKCATEAARLAREHNVDTLAVRCDVSDEDEIENLFNQVKTKFGGIHVAVANAGIIKAGTILDLSAEDFDTVMGVNLRGVFLTGQKAAKIMVDQGIKGSIINMASTNSVLAIPNQVAYVTSKGGVAQLTKAMAMGLAEHGIRVNGIGPGSVMTDVLKSVMQDEAARKMILSRTPLKRIGEPREIGQVAVFLASEYASYLTGQTIYPDGGRLSLNYVVPVED